MVRAHAIIDEATSDIERGLATVDGQDLLECTAYPAEGGAFASEQQLALSREPLGHQGRKRLAQPADGIGVASVANSGAVPSLGVGLGALPIDAGFMLLVCSVLVEGIANDCSEVARQRSDVIAIELCSKTGFCLSECLKGIVSKAANELGDGEIEVIQPVQMHEQQALALLFGVSLLTSTSRSADQCVLVEPRALLGSTSSGTSTRLIGAKQRGNNQMPDGLAELGITQLRDGLRDAVGQSEQGCGDGFENAETSFYRALAERIAFALGSMLDTELSKGIAGQLGHVRGALVGDRLQPLAARSGSGQYIDDMFGALVVIDDDRVEQLSIASTDVLGGDEFERDAEY